MGQPISDKTSNILQTLVGGFSGGLAGCAIAGFGFMVMPDVYIGDPDDGASLLIRMAIIFGTAFVLGGIAGAVGITVIPKRFAK